MGGTGGGEVDFICKFEIGGVTVPSFGDLFSGQIAID